LWFNYEMIKKKNGKAEKGGTEEKGINNIK
jgi:hypothetical protein